MKFNELKFEQKSVSKQAVVDFSNGFGASIVIGPYTYGGSKGLYELAVTDKDGLTYDTPVTDDVLGYLSKKEVEKALIKIEALPRNT